MASILQMERDDAVKESNKWKEKWSNEKLRADALSLRVLYLEQIKDRLSNPPEDVLQEMVGAFRSYTSRLDRAYVQEEEAMRIVLRVAAYRFIKENEK